MHFHTHLAAPLAGIHDNGVDQRSPQDLDRSRRHHRGAQGLLQSLHLLTIDLGEVGMQCWQHLRRAGCDDLVPQLVLLDCAQLSTSARLPPVSAMVSLPSTSPR